MKQDIHLSIETDMSQGQIVAFLTNQFRTHLSHVEILGDIEVVDKANGHRTTGKPGYTLGFPCAEITHSD